MACPKCNKYLEEGKLFCPSCGMKFEQNIPSFENNDNNLNTEFQQTTPIFNNTDSNTRTNVEQNQPVLNRPPSQRSPIPYLITIVVVTLIISVAYVLANSNRSNNNMPADDQQSTETTTETTTSSDNKTTEADVVVDVEVTTEKPEVTPVPKRSYVEPEPDPEPEIYSVMNDLYTYGWVMATNNHDSSYVAPYTVPGSPIYSMLGLRYWQERPNVEFEYISNLKIYNISKNSDGSYEVCASYEYKLHNYQTGKTSNYIELTRDTVVYRNGEYLLYDHNWVNNLPIGTYISMSNF